MRNGPRGACDRGTRHRSQGAASMGGGVSLGSAAPHGKWGEGARHGSQGVCTMSDHSLSQRHPVDCVQRNGVPTLTPYPDPPVDPTPAGRGRGVPGTGV